MRICPSKAGRLVTLDGVAPVLWKLLIRPLFGKRLSKDEFPRSSFYFVTSSLEPRIEGTRDPELSVISYAPSLTDYSRRTVSLESAAIGRLKEVTITPAIDVGLRPIVATRPENDWLRADVDQHSHNNGPLCRIHPLALGRLNYRWALLACLISGQTRWQCVAQGHGSVDESRPCPS
ncbi:hypothetical protein J6590_002761 [Homalodisca vitripennis]|nr:hypothetical protein J6590_002761 [Homalodisca vitripennis]